MDFILIGIIAGTIMTAGFPNKEACMGRVATLHEAKIEAKCVESPRSSITTFTPSGTVCLYNNGGTNCQ